MLLALLLALLSIASATGTAPTTAVRSEQRPVRIASLDDAKGIHDPRALIRAGDHWLEQGNRELAHDLFELAYEHSELTQYMRLREYMHLAVVAEHMKDYDRAAELWREGFTDDVHFTLVALRIVSEHPEREALFEEGLAQVNALVDAAKRGEQAQIYTTSKGAPRYLEVLSNDEVLRRIRAGDASFRYCYIEELDLSSISNADLPPELVFNRCVLGSVRIPDHEVHDLTMRAIVLGDLDLGKTWAGEVNRSEAIPPSRFESLLVRETIVLGRANFQGITATGRIAYFTLTAFEGLADFRDTKFEGLTDFRFSVFSGGANFKESRLSEDVYFGHTRYRENTTFRGLFSANDVYFDSARFEGEAHFDKCEFTRNVTFENAHFRGVTTFFSTSVGGRVNMSRSIIEDQLEMNEMHVGGMDFIGSWLRGDSVFVDVEFLGKVRFSLDDITRARHLDDPTPLLSLYRDYQGDKDAEEPLSTANSYGVEHIDDLIARIEGDISFANSTFRSFVIFERVEFGEYERGHLAQFYNTQFKGEAHFERTTFHSEADFTTIYGNELSFYEAHFDRAVIFDDAHVSGRLTLTDATFSPSANLSFYGAEISSFQVDRDQIVDENGDIRLFYHHCAHNEHDPIDERIERMRRGHPLSDRDIQLSCHDRAADEFVSLKASFGDRAMTADEDWAYWWVKHTEMMRDLRLGTLGDKAFAALVTWPIFELSFGWGVRLGNLGLSLAFWTVFFAWVYRRYCPDTVVVYNGDDVAIRDVPFHGLIYISLQSLGAFNTGWDFGEDDARFQYLNTIETFVGIIILTFFVGAYTRIILA